MSGQMLGGPWGISHWGLRGVLRLYKQLGRNPIGSARGNARPSFQEGPLGRVPALSCVQSPSAAVHASPDALFARAVQPICLGIGSEELAEACILGGIA